MKKLSIFALLLLLVSQTILGPLGTVKAQEISPSSSFSLTEGDLSGADELKVEEGETVTLNYNWALSELIAEEETIVLAFPEQLLASEGQSGPLMVRDIEIGKYLVEGNQLIVTVHKTSTDPETDPVRNDETGEGESEPLAEPVDEVTGADKETETDEGTESDTDTEVDTDKETETGIEPETSTWVVGKTIAQSDAEEAAGLAVTGSGTISVITELAENAEGTFMFGGQEYIVVRSTSIDSGATGLSESGFDLVVDTSVIHTITAPADIEDLRPEIGDSIKLNLNFTLPQNHNYGEGSILTYSLPTPLLAADGSGELRNEDGVIYANYKIENGEVIIEFNEKVRYTTTEGGTGGLLVNGWFEIEASFYLEEGNNDLEHDLTLPGSDTIKITFKPKNGEVVSKAVEAENNSKNSKYVNWTVLVNTEMNDLGTEGKIFKDELIGNHSYDPNSLKVFQLEIGADGKIPGEEVDVSEQFKDKLIEDVKSFELHLTGKHAYKIEYMTIPSDSEESEEKLENSASFNGTTDKENVTITYGEPLTKKVVKSGETANWTIEVNKNRKLLKKDLVITDTWTTNSDKHEFVGNIIVDGLESNEYKIDKNDSGFTLTLQNDVSSEFKITYSTKPKDLVTGTISLKNKVDRSDRSNPGQEKTAEAPYKQNVISKSNSNINYQEKTVDWKIVLNTARYEMNNIILDDIFVEKNLKIIDGTFKVKVGNNEFTNFTLTELDSSMQLENATGDKKGGFKLEIPGPISEVVMITYTTEYDVRGVTNLGTYTNKASFTWGTNNEYGVADIESKVTINDQQQKKGYKTGSYDYGGKKFDWSVGINYNFDTITNATFTDTLSESQVIDRDSIKVYKLNLTSGDNGEITGAALEENSDYTLTENPLANTFTLKFSNEITEPYRIIYESRNKLDYYEPGEVDDVVKNTATLTGDGEYSAQWNSEVTVKYTNKLITKEAKQQNASGAKLNWTLKLNWGQSTLKNVVITDAFGKDSEGNPNQMIYEDTINICEQDFTGTNPVPDAGVCHEPGGELYDVSFGEDGSTFKIKFKKDISKAYSVHYDSYILGASGDEVTNSAKMTYESQDGSGTNEDSYEVASVFNFTGGASAYKGQLQITKVDEENESEKLSGAVFELWSAVGKDGILIERVSTDVDGVYTFKTKVGQGDYYLIETKSPDGYTSSGSGYENRKLVEIKADRPAETPNYVKEIDVENKSIKQAVILKKVDATDTTKTLAGAEFSLFDENGHPVLDSNNSQITRTTTGNGEIVIENLLPGKYYFIETLAPEHYILETDEENRKTDVFEIIENQTVFTDVTMKNTRGTGSLIITKTDFANGEKLSGTEFELTSSAGYSDKKVTDSNGQVEFTGLPYDTYTLKETQAKPEYVIDGKEYTIIVSDALVDNKLFTKTITNKKITRSVQLTKYNSNKTLLLPNAVFELRKMNSSLPDGYEVVTTIDSKKLVTDDNGTIYLDGLQPGDYQFVETTAPSGYYLNNAPVSFMITNLQTATVFVEKTNNLIPNPTWPVEPGIPVDPDKPGNGDPEDPEDPTKPNKPGEGDPNDPNKPNKPGEEDPEDPNKPGKPGEEDPADPNKPNKPGEEDSESPNDPNNPGQEDPNNQEKPDNSYKPGKTETPTDDKDSDTESPDKKSGDVEAGNGSKGNGGTAAGNGEKSNSAGKDTLPQTGEQSLLYMSLVGFALIVLGGFMVRRRKINE